MLLSHCILGYVIKELWRDRGHTYIRDTPSHYLPYARQPTAHAHADGEKRGEVEAKLWAGAMAARAEAENMGSSGDAAPRSLGIPVNINQMLRAEDIG